MEGIMKNKLKFRGPLKNFIRWPLYLSAFLVILNLLVYMADKRAGMVMSVGVLIYIAIAAGLQRYHRPVILNDLIAFANQYDRLERRMLEELALPFGIMDMNGKMIWSNKLFSELTGKNQFYRKNISGIFPELTKDKLPCEGGKEHTEISTEFGDRIYRVSMQMVTIKDVINNAEVLANVEDNVNMIAMYLYDETELKEYIQKNEDNKLVIALAYLDNYEEALESVEDVRRSLLIALIDRKITKYFSHISWSGEKA